MNKATWQYALRATISSLVLRTACAPAVGLVCDVLHIERATVPGQLVGILECFLRLAHILKLHVVQEQHGGMLLIDTRLCTFVRMHATCSD
jgi:hypothetical protein